MWSVIFLIGFSIFYYETGCGIFSVIVAIFIFFIKFNFFYLNDIIFFTSFFYLDPLSFYFIFLSFLLILFVYVLEGVYSNCFFVFLLNSLFLCLFLFFCCANAIYFFIFFEASFIFIFLMIMLWGHNPERIEALNYFMIYSLSGSIPLLVVILSCQNSILWGFYFWDFAHLWLPSVNLNVYNGEFEEVFIFWNIQIHMFFWILVFLIKFPIFGLHLWLPKAHVESPVFGSMLLAGILIKLGVYGIFRFIFSIRGYYFLNVLAGNLFYYACFGLIVLNFICSRQWDLKAFVAYSSIVHMSIIIFSIFSGSFVSVFGCVLLSFAHGVCSSALFLNVNGFYLVSGSRSLYINRGFLYINSLICFFWFILTSSNCSLPLGLNFLSEVLLLFSGVSLNISIFFIFFFNIFFCGLFCIFLFLYVTHGKNVQILNFNCSCSLIQSYYMLLLFHFFVLYFYFGVFASFSSVS